MWLDDDRMGWDGVYHHRHLHETRHYQQPTKPTNQPKKDDANNNNNILQIHFYDDTPLFLRKIMSFFWVDGWMERERRENYIM